MSSQPPAYVALVDGARDRVIDFCRRLLSTPSYSGQEGDVAHLVTEEMRALGYAEVRVDEAGNVLGRIAGGSGSATLLHSHMDVVDAGDASRWRFPPFGGAVADEHLWGRGAVDDKGSLAAQVYAAGLLAQAGVVPPGDLWVAAVVGEEVGGSGTLHLIPSLCIDRAIIGEPSNNTLRRGHRGRFEFVVSFHGRSAHASAPRLGLNPHYSMARFLLALRDLPLRQGGVFGGNTIAPTLSFVDQTSSNVIPSEVGVHLDWRSVPGERIEEACALVEALGREAAEPGIVCRVEIPSREVRAYTGLVRRVDFDMPSFCLAPDDPTVLAAQAALEGALGRRVPVDIWRFTTDGGLLAAAGITCIGYGPGDDAMAHVVDERLSIEQLLEATAGYMALASAFA